MEKYVHEIIAILLIVAIASLKDGYQWYKSTGKLRFFNQNVELDVQIQRELKSLVDRFDFDRVSVIKYHNGTESFDGFSFNYATMTHEEVNSVSPRIINEFQKIPLTSFSEVLKEMKDSSDRYIRVKSDNTSSGIMQAGWNVKESYNFMLGERVSDGIICCALLHRQMDLRPDELHDIKATSYKINLLLNKRK